MTQAVHRGPVIRLSTLRPGPDEILFRGEGSQSYPGLNHRIYCVFAVQLLLDAMRGAWRISRSLEVRSNWVKQKEHTHASDLLGSS